MIRTKFSVQQPAVKYFSSDDKYYIFICLNEEEIDEIEKSQDNMSNNDPVTTHYFVYDYEEIIETKDNIDVNDVQSNPEKYMNYELLGYKKEKIKESKELLADYLQKHPIVSTCHGNKEAFYSITEEKQSLMVRALLMYQSKLEVGIEAELRWNSTGNECEVWTIDEFKQLMLEIDMTVTPLVSAQQKYENVIMACSTKEEIDKIVFVLGN